MRTRTILALVVMSLGFSGMQAYAGATAASTTPIVPPPPPPPPSAAAVIPVPPVSVPVITEQMSAAPPASISAQTLALAQNVLTSALSNPAALARLGLTATEVSALLAQIEQIPVRN